MLSFNRKNLLIKSHLLSFSEKNLLIKSHALLLNRKILLIKLQVIRFNNQPMFLPLKALGGSQAEVVFAPESHLGRADFLGWVYKIHSHLVLLLCLEPTPIRYE